MQHHVVAHPTRSQGIPLLKGKQLGPPRSPIAIAVSLESASNAGDIPRELAHEMPDTFVLGLVSRSVRSVSLHEHAREGVPNFVEP
eukprot:3415900-Amphidinium_carterae.1